MDSIQVTGGAALHGTVRIHGAKNDALPILAATAAVRGKFVLRNCPKILDIELTEQILHTLRISTVWDGDTLLVDSTQMQPAEIPNELACQMRASVLFLGALLTSCGRASIPFPGGDWLGFRPVDYHIRAMERLGAQISAETDRIIGSGKLHAGVVELPFPSVGATENLLLSALGADGPVRIVGAAKEPEVSSLAAFLSGCGAQITGIGTSCLTLTPGPLHGTAHEILPDRMETVTYLCAAACAGGEVTLTGVRPELSKPVLDALRTAGCELAETEDTLTVRAGGLHAVPPIVTAPYPGFPTDAQPLVTAALLRSDGITVVEERVFGSRFHHIPALLAMGANLETAGQILRIRGVEQLHGADVTVTDLRGGAAMLLAALGAEGESLIRGARILRRGYQDLIPNLRSLGANLREV